MADKKQEKNKNVNLEAIKLKKTEKKKESKPKEKPAKQEKENPFQEKDKFSGGSVIDMPAPTLPSTPTSLSVSQNLENLASEEAAETGSPIPNPAIETPVNYSAGYQSGRASSRATGARNLPQYSPTRTTEEFSTVEARTATANSPPPLRALQRAQFQDSSVNRFSGKDGTDEYYSQQERPDFAKTDLNSSNVQSASRGKRDINLRDYEI